MKRLNDWRRVLVGVLLLVNALPYSAGGNEYLLGGFFFTLAGCAVICWPILRELFFGPSDNAEAQFGFWDGVRVLAAAVCFFLMVATSLFGQGVASILLFAAGLLIIFLRVPLPSKRINAMYQAREDVDRLRELEVLTDEEQARMDAELARRTRADRDAAARAAADLEDARSRPFAPSWLPAVIVAAAIIGCVALLVFNKPQTVVSLPSRNVAPMATGNDAPQDKTVAAAMPAADGAADASQAPAAQTESFVGSVESDKYHKPDCSAVDEILDVNMIWFASAEDAQAAGYSPCKICDP